MDLENCCENSPSDIGHDLSELLNKVQKLCKSQTDAIQMPTYSIEVIKQLNGYLSTAKNYAYETKNLTIKDCLCQMAKIFTPIIELTSQNYFSRTILQFQAMFAMTLLDLKTLYASQIPKTEIATALEHEIHSLNTIFPKILLISFAKASPTPFSDIQKILYSFKNSISSFSNNSQFHENELYLSLVSSAEELDAFIKHVTAAHYFIATVETIQNHFRHFNSEKEMRIAPLNNSLVSLKPKKPFSEISEPALMKIQNILKENRIDSHISHIDMPRFTKNLQNYLDNELTIPPVIYAINPIISILKKMPIILPNSPCFRAYFEFYEAISLLLTEILKLPVYVSNTNDISTFEKAVKDLSNRIALIEKSFPESKELGLIKKKTQPILQIYMFLSSLLEYITEANGIANQKLFSISLKSFLLEPCKIRFEISDPFPRTEVRRFCVMRAIARSSKILRHIGKYGLSFQLKLIRGISYCYPLSLSPLFLKIRMNVEEIESELFNFSNTSFKEFPVSKTGVTIVSSLAELTRKLESIILSMHVIPAYIASIREFSMILYSSGFSNELDPHFESIAIHLSHFFNIYKLFFAYHHSGAASLTSCVQITYLLTICDSLTSRYKQFSHFCDFFRSINLFDIDYSSFMSEILLLKTITLESLKKWSFSQYVEQFSKYSKSMYLCSKYIKNQANDETLSRLFRQLTSWIGNLNRTKPKQSNLRELHIRMMILKKMINNFLEIHPDLKSKMPFNEFIEIIELITELKEVFAAKQRLKQLLSFLERISFDSTSPAIISICPLPPVDNSLTEEETNESRNNIDISSNDKIEFDKNDISYWNQFAKDSLIVSAEEITLKALSTGVNIEEALKLCLEDIDVFFEGNLSNSYPGIAQQIMDKTWDKLSDIPIFHVLCKRIEKGIEMSLNLLNEFNPPPRGRGYPREFPLHPKASKIGEIQKSLIGIRSMVSSNTFTWAAEMAQLVGSIQSVFRVKDVSSEFKTPYSIFRHLMMQIMTYFNLFRISSILYQEPILISPDYSYLRVLMSIIIQKTQYIYPSCQMYRNEVDTLLKTYHSNDIFAIKHDITTLRQSLEIFNLRAITESVSEVVLDPRVSFHNIIYSDGSVCFLLQSKFFDMYSKHFSQFLDLVSSGFSQDKVQSIIEYRMKYSNQLCSINATSLVEKLTLSIESLQNIQEMFNINHIFNRLCPIMINWSNNCIDGQNLLKLILILNSIELELSQIDGSVSQCFQETITKTIELHSCLSQFKSKFGPRSNSGFSLNRIYECYMELCNQLRRIDLQKERSRVLNEIVRFTFSLKDDSDSLEKNLDPFSLYLLLFEFLLCPSKITYQKLYCVISFILSNNHDHHRGFSSENVISSLRSLIGYCNVLESINYANAIFRSIDISMGVSIDPVEPPTKIDDIEHEPEILTRISLLHRTIPFDEQTILANLMSSLFYSICVVNEENISNDSFEREIHKEEIELKNRELIVEFLETINNRLRNQSNEDSPNRDAKSSEDISKRATSEKRTNMLHQHNTRNECYSLISNADTLINEKNIVPNDHSSTSAISEYLERESRWENLLQIVAQE